ncbi:hypothetical protein BD626DRAFT_634509 [Schizophyllum amplum]|uniref:Uncharacterized protein n=1 Tax=Schizophyllum amplum TaxID=97359 RepID=A0A550BZ14_9AGAR|nr:hypothetical protein BD626DRAFT_634509 [Auriculariopsis ampla]
MSTMNDTIPPSNSINMSRPDRRRDSSLPSVSLFSSTLLPSWHLSLRKNTFCTPPATLDDNGPPYVNMMAQHRRRNGCVVVEPYFVKYDDPTRLVCDVKTRSLLSSTEQQANKPRIPELIHHFDNGQGITYVVLEHVKLAESPADLAERTALAVTWLSGVQAPPDHRLGPLGGGCIRHIFFESMEAPLPFASAKALERYVEKGRRRLYAKGRGFDPVSLTDERLVCVQGNMNESHFGVDEEGRTVLMGSSNISFVPETFARYAFVNAKLRTLVDRLGLSGAPNMRSMVAIAHNLGMTADPSLGLDNHGKTAAPRVLEHGHVPSISARSTFTGPAF